MGDGPRDNAEAKTLAPSRPESPRVAQGNQDMIEGRHLFQSGKGTASELPQTLDFGSLDNLYGTNNLGLLDRTLLAQATDRHHHPAETAKSEKPITSGADLVNIAERLGQDPHRWAQKKESSSPKCNQYVEAVLQAGHIPIPWKAGHADCHSIREALDKEAVKPGSMWKEVYAYDEKQGLQSDERFTHYQPKDGDIMIWDGMWGNEYVQHSGIVAQPYDILYAGSASRKAPHGWAHGQITDFTLSERSYGSPTAVYRYKALEK